MDTYLIIVATISTILTIGSGILLFVESYKQEQVIMIIYSILLTFTVIVFTWHVRTLMEFEHVKNNVDITTTLEYKKWIMDN